METRNVLYSSVAVDSEEPVSPEYPLAETAYPIYVECRECYFAAEPTPRPRDPRIMRGPMEKVLVPHESDPVSVLLEDERTSYKLVYRLSCGHKAAL